MCVWYTASAAGRGSTDEAILLCNTSKRALLSGLIPAAGGGSSSGYSTCKYYRSQPASSSPVSPKFLHTPVGTPLDECNALL